MRVGGGDPVSDILGQNSQPSVSGTEDCLNLAVFTPHLRPRKLMPVMVFIHGGGFILGSYTAYGSNYQLDKDDIVLVHIHYRLSSLGFLCLNSAETSSNVGLLDQVLGLQWVQKHIKYFGGDPGQVSLAGESAGSASVTYHLTSHLSRGLFQRAVAMSGSNTAQWALNTRPQLFTRRLAQILECSVEDTVTMVQCIKYHRTAEQIVIAQDMLRRENFAGAETLGSESAPCVDHNFSPPR